MDPIKEAFSKIKEDILTLREELNCLKSDISSINSKLINITLPTPNPTIQTQNPSNEVLSSDRQTDNPTIPTHNLTIQALYPQDSNVSIGNKGVPTDRQTDQLTDQQTQNSTHNPKEQTYPSNNQNYLNLTPEPISDFQKASQILNSLDSVKKAIRLKFKRLTPQEMLVFSTLYSFEEQKIDEITYKLLANNLNLSESSIRDYTNKLIKKGVPIQKIRQNNKTILLKISQDLKNIATLATIQSLREL